MLKQSLQQKLGLKINPLQIQLIKLLELPTYQLEQRIKEELEQNPLLEEVEEKGETDVNEETATDSGEEFEDEMLLMAGFTSARIDTLILALRKKGAGRINYKAVLTETNKNWDSVSLFKEIKREHEYMTGEGKQ